MLWTPHNTVIVHLFPYQHIHTDIHVYLVYWACPPRGWVSTSRNALVLISSVSCACVHDYVV